MVTDLSLDGTSEIEESIMVVEFPATTTQGYCIGQRVGPLVDRTPYGPTRASPEMGYIVTTLSLRGSGSEHLVIAAYNVSPKLGTPASRKGLYLGNTNEQGVVSGHPMVILSGSAVEHMQMNELVPTVYTLWKKYDLLPCITTPASVIPILVEGADLMIPAVVQIPSSQTVVPPQLAAIAKYITDSPTMRGPPLVVRCLAADLEKLKAGGKGKAVHLLHSWKDYLFAMGSKADPPGVVEIQEVGENKESEEGEIAGTNAVGEQGKPSAKVQEVEGNTKPPVDLAPAPLNRGVHHFTQRLIADNTWYPKTLQTSSFPIPAGALYSSYVLSYRPEFFRRNSLESDSSLALSGNDGGTSKYPLMDIKHSTHKSLATFVKILDKHGILTIEEMKPEPLVMGVSASHPEDLSDTPYVSLRDKQLKEEKREMRDEEERAKVQEMEIKEVWKPHTPSGSARFFTEGGFE
ncbi:hypothetical protein EDC04DRAFT_3139203 [Pisolithus marmoratus]|nr:hypothetical protein EDC04DRAFT_3139203 [Pisolithus marmoratus]